MVSAVLPQAVAAPLSGEAPVGRELIRIAARLDLLADDLAGAAERLEGKPARRVELRATNLRDIVVTLLDVAKGLEGSGWTEQREATPRQDDDPPGIAPP